MNALQIISILLPIFITWNSGECYSALQPRTIGSETNGTLFPYFAAIFYPGKIHPNDFVCGGSLIEDRWVITAGHCLEDKMVHLLSVATGINNLTEAVKQRRSVEKFFIHTQFLRNPTRNDIALILLKKPLKCEGPQFKISLPHPGEEELFYGKIVKVFGLGRAENGRFPEFFYSANVTPFECEETYKPVYFCAKNETDEKLGSCDGDSGGPLVGTRKDTKDVLLGIVSWGSRNCFYRYIDTHYTRVSHYLGWIEAIIKKHSN